MSINVDQLSNLYSINKIIKKDGTIDLNDLEILSFLNSFIKAHTSTENSSLKLNDEDLLELINVNKNSDDTRNFLDKFDTTIDTNCSNNIELIIDDSNHETDYNQIIEPEPEPVTNVSVNKKTRKKLESNTNKPSKKSKRKANY
jgi:hypothetical protein